MLGTASWPVKGKIHYAGFDRAVTTKYGVTSSAPGLAVAGFQRRFGASIGRRVLGEPRCCQAPVLRQDREHVHQLNAGVGVARLEPLEKLHRELIGGGFV